MNAVRRASMSAAVKGCVSGRAYMLRPAQLSIVEGQRGWVILWGSQCETIELARRFEATIARWSRPFE